MLMKGQLKVAGMLAVLHGCSVAFAHGPNVKAAGNGKITGTVKLDGTPPHMKGIDMSKDPYCAKAHENSPAQLQLVVVGKNNGWKTSFSIFRRAGTGPAPNDHGPVFDQKGCMYSHTSWRWTRVKTTRSSPVIRPPTTSIPSRIP